MKALVGISIRHATAVMRGLELDRKEWVPLSPGSALLGYRFTKIVVLAGVNSPANTGRDIEWMERLTSTKMLPEHQGNVYYMP